MSSPCERYASYGRGGAGNMRQHSDRLAAREKLACMAAREGKHASTSTTASTSTSASSTMTSEPSLRRPSSDSAASSSASATTATTASERGRGSFSSWMHVHVLRRSPE